MLLSAIGFTTVCWVTNVFTAYAMEFFLQTLVKKGYLSQNSMLMLQRFLMAVTTLAGT